MINVRQEHILKTFLRESKGLKIEELATKFSVSARTIREDLKNIDMFLYENNQKIEYSSTEKIYYISHYHRKDIERYFSKYELSSGWIPVEANQRELYILFILIFNNKSYITTEYIAEELYISKTAIANDVKRISKWIYEVVHKKVTTSKANGIKIDLKESEIRMLISSAIYRNYSSDSKYCMNIIKHLTDKLGQPDIFKLFNNIISSYLYEKNLILDYESSITLILQLIVFISRISGGYLIEENYAKNMTYDDFPFEDIEKVTEVKIPPNEKEYIKNILEMKEYILNERYITVNKVIDKIFEEYIKVVNEDMEISFYNFTDDLYNKWKKHLEVSLYKKKIAYKDEEYMPAKIGNNYKKSYKLLNLLSEIVQKHTGIEFEEKDYICNSIYLEMMGVTYKKKTNVVIVSRYQPVFLMSLNKQIEEVFNKKINVLACCSVNQLRYFEEKYREENIKIDLIIATHTVKTESKIDIDYISLPMTDSDIERIDSKY